MRTVLQKQFDRMRLILRRDSLGILQEKKTMFDRTQLNTIRNPRSEWNASSFVFFSLNPTGELTATCVVRETYRLKGKTLVRDDRQGQIRPTDEHYRNSVTNSLRYASDLAPYKTATDLLFVDPVAVAPSGVESTHWDVAVEVGTLRREFTVTGPSKLKKSICGWSRSNVTPVREVPILFDLAVGGSGQSEACRQNLFGRPTTLNRSVDTEFEAPQIWNNLDESRQLKLMSEPIALNPVAPSSAYRLWKAGRFDTEWRNRQWPLMPVEFDYGFYNSAHPSMQIPGFASGDENVCIRGMSESGVQEFNLNNSKKPALLLYQGKDPNPQGVAVASLDLDTIEFDLNESRVAFVWRTAFTIPEQTKSAELFEDYPEVHRAA